jgi:hypothetical protein
MGTWDTDSFGNDTACDWAYQLERSSDLSIVDSTIDKILEIGSDYLGASEAEEALAAAEVVARLQGNWGVRNPYTEPADAWVENHRLIPPPDLIRKTHKAIERILTSPSELLELWEDSSEVEAWKASVRELKARITLP